MRVVQMKKLFYINKMDKLTEIIQKVSCNGMREMTDERVKEVAWEFAECMAFEAYTAGAKAVIEVFKNINSNSSKISYVIWLNKFKKNYNGQKD